VSPGKLSVCGRYAQRVSLACAVEAPKPDGKLAVERWASAAALEPQPVNRGRETFA
jgi:hypothetical protein